MCLRSQTVCLASDVVLGHASLFGQTIPCEKRCLIVLYLLEQILTRNVIPIDRRVQRVRDVGGVHPWLSSNARIFGLASLWKMCRSSARAFIISAKDASCTAVVNLETEEIPLQDQRCDVFRTIASLLVNRFEHSTRCVQSRTADRAGSILPGSSSLA